MAKRSGDEILNDSLPEQSKNLNKKKWVEFISFTGEKPKPLESNYIQYFDHFHKNKKLEASSIWSI